MAEVDRAPIIKARPLSPHLQVYSRLINMVMSIFHRITGAALYFGTLIVVVTLMAIATNASAYVSWMSLIKHPIGQVVMFGYTWALLHHALGGIRHLIWDTGRGFQISTVNFLSWFTILGSLMLTGGIWFFIFKLRGLL